MLPFLLLMWLGQGLDTTTTVFAFSHPCECIQEGNPLLPDNRVGIVIVKVGMTTYHHIALKKLARTRPKLAKGIAITVGSIGLTSAIINLHRLKQIK